MLKGKISILLLTFSLVLIFFRLFLPGPKVANDYHYGFSDTRQYIVSFPSVWREFLVGDGLGEYVVVTLWSWPMNFHYGVLGSLGLSSQVLFQVMGIIPILLLGVWGTTRLMAYLKISDWGKWLGTLFYLANTYIILLIDGGQINLALAYATLPLAFVLYRQAIEEGEWRNRLKFALSALVLSVFDIRIVYFLVLLIVLDFLFELFFKPKSISHYSAIINYSKLGFLTGLILVGFHAYWLLPALLAKAPSLPATYDRPQQVEFLSFANLGHALYLLQPHWFKNVFGKVTLLRWEFIFIPLLVFLAPIVKPKNRWVAYWLVVAIVSVFLVKGASGPLPQVYPWLFSNFPGFSLFRDPTKFFFLTTLSYSVLIGITVSWLVRRIKWIGFFLVAYFLFLTSPVITGQMTGTFAKPVYQDEYFSVARTLQEDEEFGRVFWIPTKQPLGYSSPTHPSVEAARLAQRRPFAIGTVGTYETFNFLREAPFMGELFNIAGIKYLVYPFPDTRREELKQDNIDYYNTFLAQLSGLSWVEPVATDSPVPLLKTKKHQDRFFVPRNTIFVVGSDDIYTLANRDDFSLANNAMVFVEEQPGLMAEIERFPQAKILLNNRDKIDVAVGLLDRKKFIFPAQSLGFDPDPSASPSTLSSGPKGSGQVDWPASNALRSNAGWWKRESPDFISWRSFLQQKYGIDNQDFDYSGGYAISEGINSLTINHQSFAIDGVLLARVMESPRGGKIEFYQGEELIGSIDTKVEKPEEVEVKLIGYGEQPDQFFNYDKANFSWQEVGLLSINHKQSLTAYQPLSIKTEGDINVVSALAVVPAEEWEEMKKRGEKLIKERTVELKDLNKEGLQSKVQVSYRRLSPTRYIVKVEGLSGPATLAFSENYDGLWQYAGREPVPLYSLINGFPIFADGEYGVSFWAQRYVSPGLKISATTLLLAILGLLLL